MGLTILHNIYARRTESAPYLMYAQLKIEQEIIQTSLFFLGLLFRHGLRASEPELTLLLWDLTPFASLELLEEGPLLLVDVLLDVGITTFSTGWFLLDGIERGGGIRARADISLCKDMLGNCMSNLTYVKRKNEKLIVADPKGSNLIPFITGHAGCCFPRSTWSWFSGNKTENSPSPYQ